MKLFYAWALTDARGYAAERLAVRDLRARMLASVGVGEPPELVGENGRPYFMGHPELDFSLTHTQGLVACALAVGAHNEVPRVGIDAERIKKDPIRAAKMGGRFFAACEKSVLLTSHDPCRTFAEIFTAKEAYAKYTGEGLARNLSATDTAATGFEAAHRIRFFRFSAGEHVITLCVPAAASEPIRLPLD